MTKQLSDAQIEALKIVKTIQGFTVIELNDLMAIRLMEFNYRKALRDIDKLLAVSPDQNQEIRSIIKTALADDDFEVNGDE